jgi:hypothetical protein
VFVVWSDQFGGAPRHVPDAADLIPDARARHYWDEGRVVGRAYQRLKLGNRTLDIGAEAWDVWMLFDRDARWTDAGPPQPTWWEHQLRGMPDERRLEPERFAAKALELQARRNPPSDR